MVLKNKVLVCLLLVLSFPALTAKAGGSGTIELAEESTYIFFFNDLAEGDQIQYSFGAPSPIDVCFTTKTEASRFSRGGTWKCMGETVPFGRVLNALDASGTFQIPNIREYDEDWAVLLTNNDDDSVNVTYQLEVIASYVSGTKISINSEMMQNIGTHELDKRGGALGIRFGQLEAGAIITYEFQTTTPIDLYILTEEEWALLEAQMGWRYSYSDIETMRGQGEYTVSINANWVVAFVNYNNKHIRLNYNITVEPPVVSPLSQSNQRSNAVQDSKSPEDTNPVKETTFESNNLPMVHEFIYYIPILLVMSTTVIIILAHKGRIA